MCVMLRGLIDLPKAARLRGEERDLDLHELDLVLHATLYIAHVNTHLIFFLGGASWA